MLLSMNYFIVKSVVVESSSTLIPIPVSVSIIAETKRLSESVAEGHIDVFSTGNDIES